MAVTYPQGIALVSEIAKVKPLQIAAEIALGIDPPSGAEFSSRDVETLDRCEQWLDWVVDHIQVVRASLSHRERQQKFDFDTPETAGAKAKAARSIADRLFAEDNASIDEEIEPPKKRRGRPPKAKAAKPATAPEEKKEESSVQPTQESRRRTNRPKPARA